MTLQQTAFPGLCLARPKVFQDPRGYFMEAFQARFWEESLGVHFIQDNESYSSYGVIRGLHYQREPWAQSKLIRVLQGEIWDVALDLRPQSPTLGQVFSVHLSEENKTQCFIPAGFAHGFCVLSPVARILYKVDKPYAPAFEAGVHFADPDLGIDWPVPEAARILSPKDLQAPTFSQTLALYGK